MPSSNTFLNGIPLAKVDGILKIGTILEIELCFGIVSPLAGLHTAKVKL